MSDYFPIFADLSNTGVLIVGGGERALEKLRRMMLFSVSLTVVAPSFLPEIRQLADDGSIALITGQCACALRLIEQEMPAVVIVAEAEEEWLSRFYESCMERRIAINTVDRKEYCSFVFPALIKRGELTVAVSTSGASPAAAKVVRQRIEQVIPDETEALLDWIKSLRAKLFQCSTLKKSERSRLLYRVAESAFQKRRPLSDTEVEDLTHELTNHTEKRGV